MITEGANPSLVVTCASACDASKVRDALRPLLANPWPVPAVTALTERAKAQIAQRRGSPRALASELAVKTIADTFLADNFDSSRSSGIVPRRAAELVHHRRFGGRC